MDGLLNTLKFENKMSADVMKCAAVCRTGL
jgi:hypothetical protein